MFVGNGTPRKPQEREVARLLRRDGMPIKRIAAFLDVSPSSVHYWTRDIVLTPEQQRRNQIGPGGPANPEAVAARAAAWSLKNRRRRQGYQLEGRELARLGDPFHEAGCMLYWAEGRKARNQVSFCNSDIEMVAFFRRFLTRYFALNDTDFAVSLNVYTNNGLTITEIEERWLRALELPRSCLRKHMLNHMPTSSSGRARGRLPYGVADLRVHRTHVVQHIYGAIQEYGGFERPEWLG